MKYRKLLVGLLAGAMVLSLGAGWALAKIPVRVKPKARAVVMKTIDINNATAKELQGIKGIGPVLAERIVKYRKRHGPFKTKADIQKIKGIGPATFDKIKAHIKAGRLSRMKR